MSRKEVEMLTRYLSLFIVLTMLGASYSAAAEDDFTDSIQSFLHDNFDHKNVGMVIGIVDEHGSRIFSAGKLDNGTDQEVNGDTVFEIGSITKTFTTLLLQDMVNRGQMKLDDPVSKYLPKSVKMPNHGGKEITLIQLATHASGLPCDPELWDSIDNEYADYTAKKLYAFLSNYELRRDPGSECDYSNLGMSLLAHAIVLKANQDYESLVVERICRPLGMDSTRITLTPELKSRLARGHDPSGKPATNWDFQVYAGAAGLRSTAKDLLKYVSANLGLTQSSLTPLMERTHVICHSAVPRLGNTAMDWMDRNESDQIGREILEHPGGTGGYDAFIGFDKKQNRGVVVLSNRLELLPSEPIGWLLLEGVRLSRETAMVLMPDSKAANVGVTLGFDRPSRTIRITQIRPSSPAAQAGLADGLIVQKINDISTTQKSVLECDCLVHGTAGSSVRLELVDAQGKTKTVELQRVPIGQ
jgi:CubicO group peptidase (beta-lactamase class C family)